MWGLSLDGDHLALVHNRATVRVYDVSSGITLVREYTPPQNQMHLGDSMKTALSERYVAVLSGDTPSVCIWVRQTGAVHSVTAPASSVPTGFTALQLLGDTLVHTIAGGGITLRNLVTGAELPLLLSTGGAVAPIANAQLVSPQRLVVLYLATPLIHPSLLANSLICAVLRGRC